MHPSALQSYDHTFDSPLFLYESASSSKNNHGLTLAVMRSCSSHRIIKFKYNSLAAQMILLLLKHDLNGLISANLRLEEQNGPWVKLILSLVTPQIPSICKFLKCWTILRRIPYTHWPFQGKLQYLDASWPYMVTGDTSKDHWDMDMFVQIHLCQTYHKHTELQNHLWT